MIYGSNKLTIKGVWKIELQEVGFCFFKISLKILIFLFFRDVSELRKISCQDCGMRIVGYARRLTQKGSFVCISSSRNSDVHVSQIDRLAPNLA